MVWSYKMRRFEIWKWLDKIDFWTWTCHFETGDLSSQEFLDGCLRLKGFARSIDVHFIMVFTWEVCASCRPIGKTGLALLPMIPLSRCWSIVCKNSPLVAVWLAWLQHIDLWMQLVSGPILVTSGDTPKGCFPEKDLLEYYHGNGKSTIPIEKRGFFHYHVSFWECNIY